MLAVPLLTGIVMVGVGVCLWKLPDPHHQQIISLLPLLDPERRLGAPPAVIPTRPRDADIRSA